MIIPSSDGTFDYIAIVPLTLSLGAVFRMATPGLAGNFSSVVQIAVNCLSAYYLGTHSPEALYFVYIYIAAFLIFLVTNAVVPRPASLIALVFCIAAIVRPDARIRLDDTGTALVCAALFAFAIGLLFRYRTAIDPALIREFEEAYEIFPDIPKEELEMMVNKELAEVAKMPKEKGEERLRKMINNVQAVMNAAILADNLDRERRKREEMQKTRN